MLWNWEEEEEWGIKTNRQTNKQKAYKMVCFIGAAIK